MRGSDELLVVFHSTGDIVGLLRSPEDLVEADDALDPGFPKRDVFTHDKVQEQLFACTKLFQFNGYDGTDGERITNAFTSAAFLATEAWLASVSANGHWDIAHDYGADVVVPVISSTGVIVISALKGLFLTLLLGLAGYATVIPRWTDQLDSFAMLRIGPSIPDDV